MKTNSNIKIRAALIGVKEFILSQALSLFEFGPPSWRDSLINFILLLAISCVQME